MFTCTIQISSKLAEGQQVLARFPFALPNCPHPLLRWAKMCYNSRHKEFLFFVSICADVDNKV